MVAYNFTAKQSRFLEELTLGTNATQAAIRAGYSPRSARVIAQETLQNPAIQAELQARQAAESERLGVTRQQVVAGLLEAAQMAKANSDPGGMIKAFAALGALMGFYPSKHHNVVVSAPVKAPDLSRYEAMSDAELIEIINTANAAVS